MIVTQLYYTCKRTDRRECTFISLQWHLSVVLVGVLNLVTLETISEGMNNGDFDKGQSVMARLVKAFILVIGLL